MLQVGVQMGLTTLEINLALFSNVQDTHALQLRISTLVSGKNTITKTANRLTGTFIYVVIVNIIYNIKKEKKKKITSLGREWLNVCNYAVKNYVAFKMNRTWTNLEDLMLNEKNL